MQVLSIVKLNLRKPLLKALPLLGVALSGYIFLYDYLFYNFHLWLGIIVIFTSLRIEKETQSSRFLILAGIGFGVLFFVKISFLYYLCWIFSMLAIVELYYGKTNYAVFFALLLISPVFAYIKSVLGFQIRLKLTDIVARTLESFSDSISHAGNVIFVNNTPFTVDEACAGLNTLGLAISASLVLFGYFERKQKVKIGLRAYIIGLSTSFVLVLLANCIRIALIVLFAIHETSPAHEYTGIAVIVVVILIPTYFVVKLLASKRYLHAKSLNSTKITRPAVIVLMLLISCLAFGARDAFYVDTYDGSNSLEIPKNYVKEKLPKDVLKLTSPNSLIYIKPPVKLYQLEHSPTICWRGSGFNFYQIAPLEMSGYTIYTGILKNGDQELCTAWWFDNGQHKTIDNVEWRMATLKGEAPYHLVNITCASQEQLYQELNNWL